MRNSSNEPRRPDQVTEKHSPNYRAEHPPRGGQARDCHAVDPPAPPASAAENHDDANQKCHTKEPQTASKDEREKAVG